MNIENARIHQITGECWYLLHISVSLKNIAFFWDVTTCWLVICYQRQTELSAYIFRVEISNSLLEQVIRLTLNVEALVSANSFTA
jgi:hypothetical protein